MRQPELLRARLQAAPRSAGVYLFRGSSAQVIYIGKSANLPDRLRSYFVSPEAHPPRIRHLVESAYDFEVITASSEQEALLLENTLIKRYRPRFNVRLRDDKNYLYLRIPEPEFSDSEQVPQDLQGKLAAYPRPSFARRLATDPARYFGPYTDAKAIRRTVREVRTVFPFRGCPDGVFRRGKVCLDYHIGICAGPCEGLVSPSEYAGLLEDTATFLRGHSAAVTARLEREMQTASQELDFEKAAALRDRLRTVARLLEEQVTSPRLGAEVDVIGLAQDGVQGMASVLLVREGRLQGMERHALEGVGDAGPDEVLGSFLSQYYGSATQVPKSVYVSELPSTLALLESFLGNRRGSSVRIIQPRRGRFRQLVERAAETAAAGLQQLRVAQDFDDRRSQGALEDLAQHVGLAGPPGRIECYDISNTMGQQSVGSMVVFEQGRPKPAHYRIFAIRSVDGPNDFASMEEVISRRFAHLAGGASAPESSFGVMPDLVIVDGGQGQLAAADRALQRLNLGALPHFGLAKRFEELHRVDDPQPLHLPEGSPALFLVQRVRDEAHRFAITRHRARRAKASVGSRLDEVRGLGPKRKRALLRRFGSLEGIKEASLEELVSVPGVTRPVAVAVKELL